MARPQYLPDNLLAKIPGTFYANPIASPLAGQARVFDELHHPSGRAIDFDQELLQALLSEGLSRFGTDPKRVDPWLAPRVHSVVRVPRRIASDRRFWAWVAIEFGREYVRQRWGDLHGVNEMRFKGTHLRNGISRLWWAAELGRNGRNYGPVSQVLGSVRLAQFALELKYSWYRPAVIAFARTCTEKKPTDEKMRALSVRVNAYLGTRPVELVGLDDDANEAFDADWWAGEPTSRNELFDGKLEGPDDGNASENAISELCKWFGEILEELESPPTQAA